ncbi:MAG: transglutaminase family protein [Acidobacteria bacterium]|nr:transglutaminase family protein [Acidobacteriota bacterium]
MQRTVSSQLSFSTAANTSVVLAISVANAEYDGVAEQLSVVVDGEPVTPIEVADKHGGRLHTFSVAEPAEVVVNYNAVVTGSAPAPAISPADAITYVRPSRYVESDKLLPTSYAEFPDLLGAALVPAVRNWVNKELRYVLGSSRGTDGAVETLLHRRGVCRDYAHLAIALLRAKDVPARLAAVYAPGLSPMDFHAVAEAWIDDQWQVIDPTGLAPREAMLRIATGRDASDTAFLSTVGGALTLHKMHVTATVDGNLPVEDAAAVLRLR